MPLLTIQFDEATSQRLEKDADKEGKEPARFVADMVASEIEQAEALEALNLRCTQSPHKDKFLRILSKVPNNPPDTGDEW
ncbi:hypothetical protein [Prosthecobacter sp.]|uniref:hypothetical protein n=1 Tax=Prosthecobacter sp. TaxID=1965333 RepID=UPI0037839277